MKSKNTSGFVVFPLAFAGAGLGASILGGAMPSPAGSALTTTGRVMGRMVPPFVALSTLSYVDDKLDKVNKKVNRRKLFGI